MSTSLERLERSVRLLRGYAIVSTAVLGVVALAAFRQPRVAKFDQIDVERINVVEPDGKYRMVISNRPRSIGPIYKGRPFGYEGGTRPGVIFFNDEGTENGGMTFEGKADADGKFHATTHMSFDQFNQDQVLNLDYDDANGDRLVGMTILDRAQVDIHDLVLARDSILAIADTAARTAAMRRLAGPHNGVPLRANRVFLGRGKDRSALLSLSDPNGRARIRMAVDSTGTPALEFFDAGGRLTYRLPR